MPRPLLRTLLLAVVALAAAVVVGGCGETGPKLASSSPLYQGQHIFNRRCGGCHTFDEAGTEGSATNVHSREFKDGPNFNQRKEQFQDVLYAIRNGGFSSGPMPQNIVVGREAQLVACFVATYSGKQAVRTPTPGKKPVTGSGTDNCKQQLASK